MLPQTDLASICIMKKIKGQGTLTKFTASKIALFHRNNFLRYITKTDKLKRLSYNLSIKDTVDIKVVSFSSSRDFSEQVLSILSFITYVGQPNSWVIYSDGSHTEEEISIVEESFCFVKVEKFDLTDSYINENIKPSLLPYKEDLADYARKNFLGKRLFIYLNLEIKSSTLFIDSDIVFYEKSSCIRTLLQDRYTGWFLPDAGWGTLDSRYVKNNSPQHYQVNAGLFLMKKDFIKISGGLNFLHSLQTSYEYFSEQNVMHIIISDNDFMPLDPRQFVIDTDDQFDFSYSLPFEKMAVRHYTGPVRHKMWQAGWRTQLNIK